MLAAIIDIEKKMVCKEKKADIDHTLTSGVARWVELSDTALTVDEKIMH